MYGIQTTLTFGNGVTMFENDVKMYGIQTHHSDADPVEGLRMM